MKTITQEEVLKVLRTVMEPELHKDIVSLAMVRELLVKEAHVSMEVVLSTLANSLKDKIQEDIRLAMRTHLPEVKNVDIRFVSEVRSSRPTSTQGAQGQRLPTVKNFIAVGSGKGGVGKSTVAVNLALALKKEGAKVGLLDADIYGPSIPIMCGVSEGEKPKVKDGNRILPLERFGIPLMSMGFLIGANEAVVWRGPMLAKMLQQFLEQVEWGALDYLIVDLPPGTGDVQLTLAQLIPLSGAVVVTTPQDVALADVARAVKMFEMTKVPLLGIVQNMSLFECPHCHKESPIFGGGAESEKGRYEKWNLKLLGELPLETATRIAGDQGEPIVIREPNSKQTERFVAIARQVAAQASIISDQSELELPSLQTKH